MKRITSGLALKIFVGLTTILYFVSCATPIAPSGGEPDRTGPKLVSTSPESGTIRFNGNEIHFNFEDWVDRASFQRALSIEPGLDVDYDIKWKRKTAIIRLNKFLPDSTTIIFTLDKELRDIRSNRITIPIQIALTTGDEIDQRSVSFRIIPAFPNVSKTEPVVFLYREPFDLTEPAFYSSSADTSGIVRFNYLADGDYRAILVHDVNRNRIWDRDREFAQPMNLEKFTISEIDTSEHIPFYYAKRDTTRPYIQNIGLFSQSRLRLQFSKAIPYLTNNEIMIIDSLGTNISAYHLYNDPRELTVAYFQIQGQIEESKFYQIDGSGLTDSNGNGLRNRATWFEGSSDADTTFQRYIAPFGADGLIGQDTLYLRYSTQLQESSILDSLKVYVNREEARGSFNVYQEKNRLHLVPKDSWNSSNSYQIRAWDPSSELFKDVRLQVTTQTDTGDLSVSISDSSLIQKNLTLTLYQTSGSLYRQVQFKDSVSLRNLRAGTYHLLLFEGVSDESIIDFGEIDPFIPPAYLYADPRFPVRSRMLSELKLE